MTKNLTLSIDDELLDRARVLAAIKRTSVNEMVRSFLATEVKRETEQAAKAEAWAALFRRADAQDERRRLRRRALTREGARFDRDEMYEEAMRERGLL